LGEAMDKDGFRADVSVSHQRLSSEFDFCIGLVKFAGNFKYEVIHTT
jgi:hypothetical protein